MLDVALGADQGQVWHVEGDCDCGGENMMLIMMMELMLI
jgi:hypothetical protein